MDLSALDFTELLTLDKQVKAAIEARKPKESTAAKKAWLASDKAEPFLDRIEALRKEYVNLTERCNKSKDVVLRVKLTVDFNPTDFNELLKDRWERSFGDVFDLLCEGELLNRGDFPGFANELQSQIDGLLSDVCEDAAQIHGDLYEECEAFVDKLNNLLDDLGDTQELDITPADIVKSAAKKKGKK
jgi:hypothetical protein